MSSFRNPENPNYQDYLNLEYQSESKTGLEFLLNSREGYIVGRLNNEMLRYKTDAHFLTISPTGGGKTSGIIIPNILDHPGSMLVVDIRGETVAKTANAKRLQGHKVVILDPYNITGGEYGSDSYNPLDKLIRDKHENVSDDQIEALSRSLMFDPHGRRSNEPIWDDATRLLVAGLITYIVRYTPRYRHTLTELFSILTYSKPEMEAFILELYALTTEDGRAKDDLLVKLLLRTLTEGKSTTKITDNAVVQAQTLLHWTSKPSFRSLIKTSTFSFDNFRDDKTIVYLVVPEEHIKQCAVWIRVLIDSAVFSLTDVVKSEGVYTAMLPQEKRVLFLIDELPAFGQLDIVSDGISTLRGRGLNLWLFIQNMSQLNTHYKDYKSTIIGNAAAIQVFKSNELEELEYLAKLIGEDYFDVPTISISETNTSGTSYTTGHTRTIGNSESQTEGSATSDTVGETLGINWSETHNWQKNTQRNRGTSNTTTEGTSTNKSQGGQEGTAHSRSDASSKERNFMSSTTLNDSKNKGTSWSDGTGSTNSNSRSTNEGSGESEGSGASNTRGGNYSTNKSHTDTKNDSYTRQTNHSDAWNTGETEQQSKALQRGISVKKELRKIETVRTLREKLTDRNQFLQIRGYHPFFIPRMSYFVEFTDQKRYMFPDMASIISIRALFEIESRMRAIDIPNIQEHINYCSRINSFMLTKKYIKEWESGNRSSSNSPSQIVSNYSKFLKEDLGIVQNSCQEFRGDIVKRIRSFEEIVVSLIGYISLIQKSITYDFQITKSELIETMVELETFLDPMAQAISNLDEFKKLAISQIGDTTFSDSDHRTQTNMNWLVDKYSPTLKKIITTYDETNTSFKKALSQFEETKKRLSGYVLLVAEKFEKAIDAAILREYKLKAEYIRKHYS